MADGHQHYINQGGAGIGCSGLRWQLDRSRSARRKIHLHEFPNARRSPTAVNHRFSLFAYPWDVSPDTIPLAFARNGAGTEVTTTFWTKIFPKKFRSSNIQVNDRELKKVVGELDPEGTGSLPDRFVKLNRDMRKANTEQIYALRTNTENKILWSGPFIPVKGARESYFADRRSYYYQGKKIDEQIHLGLRSGPNHEHGSSFRKFRQNHLRSPPWHLWKLRHYRPRLLAPKSLWPHEPHRRQSGRHGAKEQPIGISGSTGMAFGDHVHFSMLVDGYQIDPKEWWDEHWIHDRILSKIGPTK